MRNLTKSEALNAIFIF